MTLPSLAQRYGNISLQGIGRFLLTNVSKFAYCRAMTASDLKRKLAKLGCTFEQGTRDLVVIYRGKATEMPRHQGKELKTGTVRGILKASGIKEL
jgi:predicted RNA binding protein YcfA (HicA-like mRNA interferase family)